MQLKVVAINYNYASFIIQNLEYWRTLIRKVDDFILIDDQSTKFQNELHLFQTNFPDQLAVTTKPKSEYNAINQMRAIALGLNKIGVERDCFFWIIDCDDVPKMDSPELIRKVVNENEAFNLYAFSRKEIPEQNIVTPKKNHPLWLTDAPTSSLVIRGELLLKNWDFLFYENLFKDTWFDIRVCAQASTRRSYVSKEITHLKINHESNDSLRYKNNKLQSLPRVVKSLIYSLACKF